MSRAILTDVSIGGTLAEARRRAGLTVADVSARTRVREGLIRAIERDEFEACGGDFYARGHIRAIAAAVGTDPAALIFQYDASHRSGAPAPLQAGGPDTPEELAEWAPRARRSSGPRRWLAPVLYLLCLVVVGFSAIWLTRGATGSPSAVASTGRAAARSPGASAGPRTAPASGRASHRPAAAAAPLTDVTPVSAAAFGPRGTSDGDDPRGASRALAGDPATPWHTGWYATARFGNLQAGTGLLLGLPRTVTAAGVTIRLGGIPGADLQLRAGPSLSGMPLVAGATGAGGTVRLGLAARPHVRYLLIWFTRLPPGPSGGYQADISSVTVSAAQ